MKINVMFGTATALCGAWMALAQSSQPLYKVTVIERNTQAVNYQYRGGPTRIDFRGTVLSPASKGEATVNSERGRTAIDSRFENLAPPTRFGREYLTYVLWAITPEGGPRNLGEIVPNGSDKARLHVTTDLQAFGMIVTAEPYAAARMPSNVVVLENRIRADTAGATMPINVKYTLMPRGHFTWEMPSRLQTEIAASGHKVSMDEYDAQLHLYEAENAIGIARAAGADRYAADTLAKAERLLREARSLHANKGTSSNVVQDAREAAERAEDARAIAERMSRQEKTEAALSQAVSARRAQAEAEAQAQRAWAEANAARQQVDAEKARAAQAEAEAAAARQRAAQAQAEAARPAAPPPPPDNSAEQKSRREDLLERMDLNLPVLDTPRGLVVTLAASDFQGRGLRPEFASRVRRVATVLAVSPGLRVDVEGFSDTPAEDAIGAARALAVKRALVTGGVPEAQVAAQGLGASRPVASNATAAGRMANQRVEIVVSGEAIGSLPAWDRTYSLSLRK